MVLKPGITHRLLAENSHAWFEHPVHRCDSGQLRGQTQGHNAAQTSVLTAI